MDGASESGHVYTDADAHVVEATFFIDAVTRWPDRISFREDGTAGFVIETRRYPEPDGPGAGCPPEHSLNPEAARRATTARGLLADADLESTGRIVLFPSGALAAPSIRDRVFAKEFADAYNLWLAEFCSEDPHRLHGVAAVGIEHVDDAIDSMRAARELGMVAAVLPPALATRNLDHPDLDPFYAAAADLDMPITVHGAPGMHLPQIGVDRFTNYIQVHMVSFPFDMMAAMTAVVSGGVLDRHPRLRFAFLEAGCGWLPYFVERMGEHFEKRGTWIANGWQRHPREYVESGQVRVSCEPEEALLPAVVDALGDRCVMWASDYPHWDGEFPHAGAHLQERADLDAATKERVARANADEFYGLTRP
ncbi:MAG: amidohydrolase family protein [Acidimicrobiia bacterium]|nr:amidohydrolase family protein [Acidimicrobiia bacterium]